MKGIVFAAGVGSRLKPFTDHSPKALVEVGGRPALALVVERLVDAGADGIVVNVHHFADQIIDYLAAHDFGVPVEISDETMLLLDTAGGMAKMARSSAVLADAGVHEPIIVHNADILTDFDLRPMAGQHVRSRAAATILADTERQSSRSFLFDDGARLRGWMNRATGQVKPADLCADSLNAAAFGGVHVVDRQFLDILAATMPEVLEPAGITDFYISHAEDLKIMAYTPAGPYKWFDLGTPEKVEQARKNFFSKQ